MYEKQETKREKFSLLTKLLRSFFWLVVLVASIGLALFAFKDISSVSKFYVDKKEFQNLLSRETLVILVAMLTIGLSFVASLSRKYFITKLISLITLLAFSLVLITITSSSKLAEGTIFNFVFENSKNGDIKQLEKPIELLTSLKTKFEISIPLIYIFVTMAYASVANGTRKIRVSNTIMGLAIIISFILSLVIIISIYVDNSSNIYKNLELAIVNTKPAIFTLLAISGFLGIFTVFSNSNK